MIGPTFLPLGAELAPDLANVPDWDQHGSLVDYDPLVQPAFQRSPARSIRRATKQLIQDLYPSREAAGGLAKSPDNARLRPADVLRLQRAAGNAAVTGFLQRADEEGEEQEGLSPVLGVVGRGGGQPLDNGLRREMEGRIGADFSDVRVHTGAEAARSAAAVAAQAYTVGNEVVFGDRAPTLESAEGKRMLAHELTHVVQQRQGPVDGTPAGGGIAISDPADRFEQAAEANAARVMTEAEEQI